MTPPPAHPAYAVPAALSVNALSQPLVAALLHDRDLLRLKADTEAGGVTVIDAGIDVPGSVEAGLRIAAVCMGGLGRVGLRSQPGGAWPDWVEVRSSQPVLACLASQYAGWSLAASKEETGGKKFFALGSGPARALAGKEPLFTELAYRDAPGTAACLVLEVDRRPPAVMVSKVLHDCGLRPDQLTLILTPTTSLAGTTQVVARVLEVALHKAHELKFPLAQIVEGTATAPLPVPHPDGLHAMGRTNDAILYAGQVHLTVQAGDDAARELALKLPSANSPDYGRPFADIFKAAEYDFYRIDPALFAPAEVWVTSLQSGTTWHGGATELGVLKTAWMK
jgi:methenyltetrahydromethanopterin cyclohydrolase